MGRGILAGLRKAQKTSPPVGVRTSCGRQDHSRRARAEGRDSAAAGRGECGTSPQALSGCSKAAGWSPPCELLAGHKTGLTSASPPGEFQLFPLQLVL